jgi:hypothetical protein
MDYDKAQLRQLLRSQLMGVGMMGVMHLYFQYTSCLRISVSFWLFDCGGEHAIGHTLLLVDLELGV